MPNETRQSFPTNLVLASLVLLALIIYSYATLRFGGVWSENDTLVLTRAITAVVEEETIINVQGHGYGNGLSFQSVSVFLINITGVDPIDLQLYIYPMITALLPLVAFVAYRALTGSTVIGLLGTLLLYIQPDFLFVTWRGSHEKITWTFTLLLIYALSMVFRGLIKKDNAVGYLVVFYLSATALVSSNGFFASSMTTALALSFVGGWVFFALRTRFHPNVESDRQFILVVRQLLLVTLVVAVLVYLFFFHIYPQMRSLLNAFASVVDGLSTLFLGSEDVEAANAYDYISTAWTSTYVYLIVSSFGWIVLFTSFITWWVGAINMLWKRELSEQDHSRLFLWLLYPTFALQLALSVVADRVDTVGGNVQVRLFTPLMLTAIPIVAIGLHDLTEWLRNGFIRKVMLTGAGIAIASFSVVGLFKFTNEPLFSNQWIFSTDQEVTASNWMIENTPDNSVYWTGVDRRINATIGIYHQDISVFNLNRGRTPPDDTQYYLQSDTETARMTRQRVPIPEFDTEQRIYDNGTTQIYYRRPLTIYQQ